MHVHLDPLGGLAGDMFLAAAIDAGLVSPEAIEETLETLGLGSLRVIAEGARRKGITGTHVRFALPEQEETSASHRHLSTILDLLDESGLSPDVRERAQSMFRTLGTAEAEIHGIPVEEVHFRRSWLPLDDIGYHAAMGALSDLAAVAARPIGVLLSMALGPGDEEEEERRGGAGGLAGVAAAVMARFGRIDAVFANAGVGGEPGGFSGAPPETWDCHALSCAGSPTAGIRICRAITIRYRLLDG